MLFGGLNTLTTNAQDFCFMDTVQSAQQGLLKGVTCTGSSTIFNNFFTKVNNYIPYPNQNIITTTPKKIKVKVIVVNNTFYPSTSAYPQHYTPSDTPGITKFVQNLCNYADSTNGLNISLSSIGTPTNPQTAICGSCHISDSKFKIELTSIDFVTTHEDMSIDSKAQSVSYHTLKYTNETQDSVLNIFMVNYSVFGALITSSNPSSGGVAGFPINNFLRASGHGIIYFKPKGDEWSKYQTLMHEIGHNYGLGHTWDTPGAILSPECPPYVPMDFFLDDVFGNNPNFCFFPNDKDPTCNPDLTANKYLCSNNLMGGKYNRIEFLSPKQLGRMHRNAYLGSCSQFTYPTEAPNVHPLEITNNQTWDFGIRMYQDIIVKAGKTLTITCEVQMPPGGKIIVEKGAKLVLDGGVISSYHPKATGSGIQLEGDKNLQPLYANQGALEMKNNAMIEYAHIGVQDFLDNIWHGGGIIDASNSKFKDCRKAVALNDYPKYARGNSCRFYKVQFVNSEIDAKANKNIENHGQFTSYNEKGVLIDKCNFENKLATHGIIPMQESNFAIYTNDAGFRITNTNFRGYKQAVTTVTVNNNPARSTKVLNSNFDSVATGIMFADNFPLAQNNTFNHLMDLNYTKGSLAYHKQGEAIYADRPNDMLLTGNMIYGNTNYFNRAITINNSKVYGARVVDNLINNTYLGLVTQNNNPKLDMLCNYFVDGGYNLVVNPESPNGSLKDQGNSCDPSGYRANNTFTENTPIHIASYLNTNWNYYCNANEPSEIPTNLLGNSVNNTKCYGSNSNTNSQCNLPENSESNFESWFDEAYTTWPYQTTIFQNSSIGLAQLTGIMSVLSDRGSTDSMITFLQNINNLESQKMLLPLYLDNEDYATFDDLLNTINLGDEDHDKVVETQSFKDYFNILRDIKQEHRPLWALTVEEKSIVQNIAQQDYEVSAFAKALLEFAYGEEWHHYQEQILNNQDGSKYNYTLNKDFNTLGNAIPNPNKGMVNIEVNIIEQNADNAILSIYDMLGRKIMSRQLVAGNQIQSFDLTAYNNGVYIYSLQINGKTIKSKRLVLQK
ncbi:MAG TPA: zinc-dependent metalloprotease [Edaphocola sp.]|nr:zinc-dependent metalloprotease [Edaphocola sp.]